MDCNQHFLKDATCGVLFMSLSTGVRCVGYIYCEIVISGAISASVVEIMADDQGPKCD